MLSRITNLIGWVGVALVFAAFALRFLKPEQQNWWWNLAAAGLVCVLIYVVGQWREFVALFSKRQARYGTFSVVSVIVVLGILGGLNYIATRENKRWDLTSNQQFTLSDQTRKILSGLNEPLKMIAFEQADRMTRFRDRLQEYAQVSKKVTVDYIDPDKEPALARQYEIPSYGTVVVEHKGRVEKVTGESEQDLTNAIIKVVSGQQKKIYFVQGHGEHDTGSADEQRGYSYIGEAVGKENFAIAKLPLAQQTDVPEDASLVVVAGPTNDYLPPEIDSLRKYLNKGGKVLFMLDPPDRVDSPPLTNLIALIKEWGIDVGDNIVIDRSGIGQLVGRGPGMPVAIDYPSHPITERFNNVMTGFPLARSITPSAAAPSGRTAQTIVETSKASWAESDVKALAERRPVGFDEKTGDKQGPISLAAALSTTAPEQPPAPTPAAGTNGNSEPPKPRETRVVVFGDSDFVANANLNVPGNGNLFLNTVNWLAEQENLISIRPKPTDDRRVTLTNEQLGWVMLFSVIFLPALVVGTGVYTWWRRR
jgi:gliding motility-associatede transport system auxiliary component